MPDRRVGRAWLSGVTAFAILPPWLLSLALPVFDIGGERSRGIGFLLFGWLGPLKGEYGWFANPLLLLVAGAILTRRPGPRLFLVCAPLLALLLLIEATRTEIVDNEGGISRSIDAFLAGWWLWIGAIALASVASLYSWAWRSRIARHGDHFDVRLSSEADLGRWTEER